MKAMEACASVSVGFNAAGAVKGNVDTSACSKSSSTSKEGNENESDSTKVIAIGSKPTKDGEGIEMYLMYLKV